MYIIKAIFLRFVLILSIFGILYSSYSIIASIMEYRHSAKKYVELKHMYTEEKESSSQELRVLNADYIGWLAVEGTDIQYPVVRGQDNDFYLTHNFHKEKDKVGAIFMDYRNPSGRLDSHTIIYGHNMRDKSMFSSLSNVFSADFLDNNRILLDFQNKTYEWEVFSAYRTRKTDWLAVDFESSSSYLQFIQALKNKSNVNFSKEVKEDDQILTLATCSTGRARDERVVVHAVLKEGDYGK